MVLVGVGRFGQNHLRVLKALHASRRIDFAGVVGKSARRAHEISVQFGVQAYPSLEAALANGLDVIDIATPASTHAALVRRSLPHAHVFVEKPLALTAEECARLYALAGRHSRLLGVGHIFRFNDAVSQVKRIISRRARPHLIRIDMTGSSEPPTDVGAILTYLHVFDLLDELIEAPPRETIPITSVMGKAGLERHAVVALAYPRGLSAVVEVGWIGGAKRRVLEVSFEDLLVRCDLVSQTVELSHATRPSRVLQRYRREPLRREIEHFLDALRGRHHLRPSPREVLRVMRMAGDAQKALRRGRPVKWRS